MFHYPVAEEEAPDYRSVIPDPMDMATVLQRVDSGHYLTRTSFMKDIELIASNAKVSFFFLHSQTFYGCSILGPCMDIVQLVLLPFFLLCLLQS
jgi:Bromodomain